jgi:hypothetical protein
MPGVPAKLTQKTVASNPAAPEMSLAFVWGKIPRTRFDKINEHSETHRADPYARSFRARTP